MVIERAGLKLTQIAVYAFIAFSILAAVASPAAAQVSPRWEVFGGYSYRRFDAPTIGFENHLNLNGWNFEGAFNITREWSIVGDASGQYGSSVTLYNFMGGPQYSWRRDKSKFYGHALFGKAQNTVNIATATRNSFESVGFSAAAGGGYDRDLTPRFTWRIQGDYLHTSTFGSTQNDFRISTGLVFHFGQIGRRPKL